MSLEKISFNKPSIDNLLSPEKSESLIEIKNILSSINLEKTFDIASRAAISYKANFASKV
jgi:TATA-box binding protein (TBP) (component of TFIID and TFIIIB)